jgi:hypothetical protein
MLEKSALSLGNHDGKTLGTVHASADPPALTQVSARYINTRRLGNLNKAQSAILGVEEKS